MHPMMRERVSAHTGDRHSLGEFTGVSAVAGSVLLDGSGAADGLGEGGAPNFMNPGGSQLGSLTAGGGTAAGALIPTESECRGLPKDRPSRGAW